MYSHCICVFEYSLDTVSSQQLILCVLSFVDWLFSWQCHISISLFVCENTPIVLACTSVFMENIYTISAIIERILFMQFAKIKLLPTICFELSLLSSILLRSYCPFFSYHRLWLHLQNSNLNVHLRAVSLCFLITQLPLSSAGWYLYNIRFFLPWLLFCLRDFLPFWMLWVVSFFDRLYA